MPTTTPTWKGSVFARGRKLWLKVKSPTGWRQLPTSFHVSEERKARALLAQVRDRLVAGEEVGGLVVRVTVERWSKRWRETREALFDRAGSDGAALGMHVLPHIGGMELAEVRPRHVAAMVRGWIGESYAPRTSGTFTTP